MTEDLDVDPETQMHVDNMLDAEERLEQMGLDVVVSLDEWKAMTVQLRLSLDWLGVS
jgi:hypothetical protein